MNKGRVVTFGELMLRLCPPRAGRLLQEDVLRVAYGGCEANVAVSLRMLGMDARFVSSLPDNALGRAALSRLRALDVDCSFVRLSPRGRMGMYFAELGCGDRPAEVLYDRENASFALEEDDFPWSEILEDATGLHISGITPALGRFPAKSCASAIACANRLRVQVSCDMNHRARLWAAHAAPGEIMEPLLRQADLLFINAESCRAFLGLRSPPFPDDGFDYAACRDLMERTRMRLRSEQTIVMTLRISKTPEHARLGACFLHREHFFVSGTRELFGAIDRIGAGDAFCAGFLFACREGAEPPEAMRFALAACALKHTIPGDFHLSTKTEVEALCKRKDSGRVVR